MSIRTVNFRDDVLYPMADLLGIDWAQDLTRAHARSWSTFINARVRQAWEAWDWREFNVTEERAFRSPWNSTAQYTRGIGQAQGPAEIYYLPNQTYYQALTTAPSDPPIGTLPTNATYWQPLNPVSHFIAFDQPGEEAIGQIEGIYASDPGISDARRRGYDYTLSERGIEVTRAGNTTVWIVYKMRPSKFSTLPWSVTAPYKQGNVVYWTDGQCYRAIADTTNQAPTDSGYWAQVPMPYVLCEYVKYAAAADAADDATQQQNFMGNAGNALQREIDKLVEQGQTFPRYRGGSLGCRRPFPPIAYYPVAVPVT